MRYLYTFLILFLCADTPGLGKIGVLAESAVRRSTRRKRVRGEKEFIVDSDTLLRDLKVKVSNHKSADVNRVGLNSMLGIRIRSLIGRIICFLCLPETDLLVRGTDTDPSLLLIKVLRGFK